MTPVTISPRATIAPPWPKDGRSKTPEYKAWQDAKERTTNPKRREWAHYGGRGIAMCEEWSRDFDAFLREVGPRPRPGYSLDRIDNDGDYAPGNVRWATWKEQRANRLRRPEAARPPRADEPSEGPVTVPTIVPIAEAAQKVGCSKRLLQKWLHAGFLVPYSIRGDRRRFVDLEAVQRLRAPQPFHPDTSAQD